MCKHTMVEQIAVIGLGDCPVCLRAELETSVAENVKLVAENVRLHNELGEWQGENAKLHAENENALVKAYNSIFAELPTLTPTVAMELAKAKLNKKLGTRGEGVINRSEHGR